MPGIWPIRCVDWRRWCGWPFRKNQPDLQRGLDTIQVKQEGRVVRLTADIPEDLAEKLLM